MSNEEASEFPPIIQRMKTELQPLSENPATFYPRLLELAERELKAVAGMVFFLSGETLTPVAEHQFLSSGIRQSENEALLIQHQERLQKAFVEQQPVCLRDVYTEETALPNWAHLMLLPLADRLGMVEFVFPSAMEPPTELDLPSELISLPFLDRTSDPHPFPGHTAFPSTLPAEPEIDSILQDSFREEVIAFTQELNRSLKVREVAGVAVNHIARLLSADRVTVLVQRGKKLTVLESSGQEKVHSRANLVRSLQKLVDVVLPRRTPFIYPDQVQDFPAAQEKTLAEFVQQAQSAHFLILPLFQPAPLLQPGDTSEEPVLVEPERIVRGALMVETGRVHQPASDWQTAAERLAAQVEGPLCNAEQHQRLPLRFLWSFLGDITDWLQGRRRWKVGLLLGVLFLVGLTLSFWPRTYRVKGEGELLPIRQRYVFAPFDGKVQAVHISTGDQVLEDQPLLRLRNDPLETEWTELSSQKQLKIAQLETLRLRREEVHRTGTREELTRVQGEIEAAEIEVAGLAAQLDILDQRRAESVVRAPQSGTITTFQPQQTLAGRAVSRGEILLEVMDDSLGWRLELTIEETRLGHLLEAIAEQDGEALLVEFFLATEPETTYEGTLQLIAVRPRVSQEEGSVIEVFVQIPDDQNFRKRIGATVKARIRCGRKSLGYVLFGDFIEYFKRRFWL